VEFTSTPSIAHSGMVLMNRDRFVFQLVKLNDNATSCSVLVHVTVKVKVTLEPATKAQRRIKGIDLLFL
jgi:hypothetical protein